MIRFKIREQVAKKMIRERRAVSLAEVARETGINRGVISGLANQSRSNTLTENLDRLCRYFGCSLEDIAEYVEDPPAKRPKTNRSRNSYRTDSTSSHLNKRSKSVTSL